MEGMGTDPSSGAGLYTCRVSVVRGMGWSIVSGKSARGKFRTVACFLSCSCPQKTNYSLWVRFSIHNNIDLLTTNIVQCEICQILARRELGSGKV